MDDWELGWKIAVIFWGVPLIVFVAGYVWVEVYGRLKKKWKQTTLQIDNDELREQIKEFEAEIIKRPAKPLYGEARSILLKAMDNSANIDDAIERYEKLQERIEELEAWIKKHLITTYPDAYCSEDCNNCPEVDEWLERILKEGE